MCTLFSYPWFSGKFPTFLAQVVVQLLSQTMGDLVQQGGFDVPLQRWYHQGSLRSCGCRGLCLCGWRHAGELGVMKGDGFWVVLRGDILWIFEFWGVKSENRRFREFSIMNNSFLINAFKIVSLLTQWIRTSAT